MNTTDQLDRDHRFIARAVELAKRGLYTTKPNPRVGCVVVQGEEIVGEGWHERAGEPHAEIHALSVAGEGREARSLSVSNRARTPGAQGPVPKPSWMPGSAELWQR